jgi:hypothetical protein
MQQHDLDNFDFRPVCGTLVGCISKEPKQICHIDEHLKNITGEGAM